MHGHAGEIGLHLAYTLHLQFTVRLYNSLSLIIITYTSVFVYLIITFSILFIIVIEAARPTYFWLFLQFIFVGQHIFI